MSENKERIALAIEKGINPESLNSYSEGWVKPTGAEVRALLKAIGHPTRPGESITGSQVASFLGLSDSRNVRYWQGKEGEADKPSSIPYTAWCWLVYKAGFGVIPK